jgi:hypothetical protein
VRKAALIATTCVLATRAHARGGEATSLSSPSKYASSQIDNDSIRPIHQLGTSIALSAGDVPTDFARRRFPQTPKIEALDGARSWAAYAYFWKASALCYGPLYFEEPNLERHGHGAHPLIQPVFSGAHFLALAGALPVKAALERPCACHSVLGHARPGSGYGWQSCAPLIGAK